MTLLCSGVFFFGHSLASQLSLGSSFLFSPGTGRYHSCSRNSPGWDSSVGGATSPRRSLWSKQAHLQEPSTPTTPPPSICSCNDAPPALDPFRVFLWLSPSCQSPAASTQILTPPLPCCVTLDRLFNLSEHLPSHLQNGHNHSNHS